MPMSVSLKKDICSIYREELNSDTREFRPHWFVKAIELSEKAYHDHSETWIDQNGDLVSDDTALEAKRVTRDLLDCLAVHFEILDTWLLEHMISILEYELNPEMVILNTNDLFLERLLDFLVATQHTHHYNALKAHFRTVFLKLLSFHSKDVPKQTKAKQIDLKKALQTASPEVVDWANIALSMPAMLGLNFDDLFRGIFRI